jgi:hypothetical protein
LGGDGNRHGDGIYAEYWKDFRKVKIELKRTNHNMLYVGANHNTRERIAQAKYALTANFAVGATHRAETVGLCVWTGTMGLGEEGPNKVGGDAVTAGWTGVVATRSWGGKGIGG